jgi:hypothetical protein
MTITTLAPAMAGDAPDGRIFPTCTDWCAWHYPEDTPEEPGSCWAEDVEIPGAVEIMATWDEQRTTRVYTWPNGAEPVVTEEPAPPLSITAFRADLPVGDDAIQFTTLEQAEATAHALLGMVARIRGDEQLAAVHIAAALSAAEHQAQEGETR